MKEPCDYLAAGKSPVRAFVVQRSTADANVCDLVLRNGTRVTSVPRWNEQGPRPPFDVWTEPS